MEISVHITREYIQVTSTFNIVEGIKNSNALVALSRIKDIRNMSNKVINIK